VANLSRLLLRPGILIAPLPRGKRPQRRARHLRARGQQLERGDQRVTAEEGVKAAGIFRGDGQRGGIRPALIGFEQRQIGCDVGDGESL
jgi:hypothetical protein